MEKVIKKGVSILLVYLLLFLFAISMTNRVERLDKNKVENNVGIELLK